MKLRPLLTAMALAAAALVPVVALADGGVLDLSAVSSRVDEGVASGNPDRKVAKTYAKLQKTLAKDSRKGLRDDFKKVRGLSKACSGALSVDPDLRTALDGVLDEVPGVLEGLENEADEIAALLDSSKSRAKVLKKIAQGRGKSAAADEALEGGDENGAIKNWARAAASFEGAAKLAAKLRAKSLKGNPQWSEPMSGLGGALLSVWGGSGPVPDLYVVGAEDSAGPIFMVLHRGAEGWVRLDTGEATGDLWWVSGVPGDGVWASGSSGMVLRYDTATRTVEDVSPAGVDAILYGVWGAGPGDVWAVGGAGEDPEPTVLHWDGESWTPFEVPEAAIGQTLFKVWGTATDDVWACGRGGVILHWDGDGWDLVPSGTSSTLLTIQGSSPTVAVGGAGVAAAMTERDAEGNWAEVPDSGPDQRIQAGLPALNGVFVPEEGTPIAVGFMNTILERRTDGTWLPMDGAPSGTDGLHAVWIDDEGNAVMVGGNLYSLATGHMVAYGHRHIPALVLPQARFRDEIADLLYLSCATAGCHLPPFVNEGLDFSTPEVSLRDIVGVASRESSLLRVSPGHPSESYLVHKVAGTHLGVGGSGDRMPADSGPLSQEDVDAIRAWILAGAEDD